ncbi:hypothetical protein Lmor_1097 [Legionella moravica]|uniref:UPF0250 protein Lmor_1097 n=1 Tax=Legionella moravica TaxID=39962 RepID=A0A378JXL3_9GAMM|nr:DUF493 domain-containing protein [Legionella moravica]KTD35650.1 hypothetical protein Lmor_1097 [Legionella moravica]STX62780.1 putative lipoate regulatory protein YbeD [Legionella moravica]
MTKKSIIEFPCDFPVKIIGINSDVFLEEIRIIVNQHFPDFNHDNLTHKLSEKSSYLAITVTVCAINQEMLDSFYQDLTKHPDVKMVL